jgi:hypothetical protein
MLRHGHWQLSQLAENVASEPRLVQLEFSFEKHPDESGCPEDKDNN